MDSPAPTSNEFGWNEWSINPTPDRLKTVVSNLDPVISSTVRNYLGNNVSETVAHRARLLAAKAVKTYIPNKGANLKTHVQHTLQGIRRIAPSVVDPLAPPERFRYDQTKLTNAITQMKTDLGREPSDEELADITGIALPRVIKVRKRMRSRVPFSVAEGEDDDENSGTDVAVSRRTPYDDWVDAVYHDLGEIDKIILQHRSGYRGAEILPNQEIAKKLGLSPAAVSQKAARIQARLDEFNG